MNLEDPPLDASFAEPPPLPRPPKGWYSRGYHPHFDQPGLVQSLTFRLDDSVPESLLEQWRAELGLLGTVPAGHAGLAKLRARVDKYEDAGHGACHLRHPEIAAVVEEALLHFDGERYRLLEWCVMPNHVHSLVETIAGHAIADVVRSWKSFSGREANRILGRRGKFWMADYFDRFIRDERHLAAARGYVRANPVKAGLCQGEGEWRFGSAWEGMRAGGPRTQGSAAGGPCSAEGLAVALKNNSRSPSLQLANPERRVKPGCAGLRPAFRATK